MKPLQTTGPGIENLCGEVTAAGGECNIVMGITGGDGDHVRERSAGHLGAMGRELDREVGNTAPAIGAAALAVLVVLVLAVLASQARRLARRAQ